jgi:hypothetical protein
MSFLFCLLMWQVFWTSPVDPRFGVAGAAITHDRAFGLSELTEITASIVWMSESRMLPGKQYNFKHSTKSLSGNISVIHHRIDVNKIVSLCLWCNRKLRPTCAGRQQQSQ